MLPLVAAVLLYGAVWMVMNLGFIAHRFPAPFLTGANYFRRYSRFVGGPVEYAANLFSQSYSMHWAGALAFTLLALGAWAIARGILRGFSPGSWGWQAAVFPLLILILASRYVPVANILPMAAGLAAAWLYIAICQRPRSGWAESVAPVVCLIASIAVYFLVGSGFLYLCAVCALFEFLVRKRAVLGLAWIAIGVAVPYGMSYLSYEPGIVGRYLRGMTKLQFDAFPNALIVAMYACVPAGAVAAFLAGRLRMSDRWGLRVRRAAQVAGFAGLGFLAWQLVALRVDRSGWLYADYLVDEGRPEEALVSLAQAPEDSDPVRFRTFYTLARAGRLLWEMFHYPQSASSDALLFRDTHWDNIPRIADWRSDLYLELGRVNESQRWAHEALASEGETPRVLERMALVYVLNGNPDAARTFLRALEKIPFQEERGREYLAAIDRDPGMRSDPVVARIQPLMLREDYVGTWSTEQILLQCLEANPSNRMAFEYLMAHYLLTNNMEGFARLGPLLKEFYTVLPTHVQEALLSFKNGNDALPAGVDGSAIDRGTAARFQRFLDIYLQHQNSPEAGWRALAPEFGGTYWFFYIFGRTSAGPPPQSGGLQETKGTR